jgi:short-subunit dehydrogenase
LVNNAGIGMRKPFHETDLATIEAIMRVNYLGAVYCTHELLPSMIERRSGHIVNISSVAGKIGTLNMAAYCASKFAMNGWSESLYHELKPLGVKVSVVCPGPVHTGFASSFRDSQPQAPESLYVSISAVSEAIIRVVERDTAEHVMPLSLAFFCWLNRFSPGLFRYLAQRRFRPYVDVPANPRS